MTPVADLAKRANDHGYPALGLMDHGTMAGTLTLYTECMKYGMLPFPGVEIYLVDPYDDVSNAKAQRYHLGLLALTAKGYKGLTKLVSLSHTRPRFSRFPRLTMDDLADLAADHRWDIALFTGCFFGLVQQSLVNASESAAKAYVTQLATMFPNTFVEVQNHDIVHDEDVVDEIEILHDSDIVDSLIGIADAVGLPVMATQDNHYLEVQDKSAHALMKRMVYGSVEDEFPGDSFHLAREIWVQSHYDDHQWDRALSGAKHLLSLHDLHLEPLDKYRPRIPKVGGNSQKKLTRESWRGLAALGIDSKESADRLVYELAVIADLGMADYFLIWERFATWARGRGRAIEARGSANGSLVCFVLGITSVNPLDWDLSFDRFLTRDRIKPPDIDMDVEDDFRRECVAYLQETYGVVHIGSFSKLGASPDNPDRGAALVTYLMSLRRRCEAACIEAMDEQGWNKGEAMQASKELFRRDYGWIKGLRDVKAVSEDDWNGLLKIIRMDSVYKSYGVHAAGLLLSGDDFEIDEWVPTSLVASSNTRVSQYDGDSVETLGALKMDLLGQTTLRVMRVCQELIGRDDPTDFTWIPSDDKRACRVLREGRPDSGVFHFEGYTKAKGGKEMQIKSTHDAVLATALFMPGAMDIAPGQTISQKDLFMQRRKSPQARAAVTYPHPAFRDALRETHGAVVFQDQVMAIMRGLGMSIEGVNNFLKVVKDSGKGATARNQIRMAEVRTEFDRLCAKGGVDADWAWGQTAAFVTYGFNKPHAAGYGVRAYRCAYLKAHYPAEFMVSLLIANAGKDKEPIYVREARHQKIRVLPPSVNSGATWALDDEGHIHRGMVSIKGVGEAAAQEIERFQPYDTVIDIIERCDGRRVTGGKSYLKDGTLNGCLKALYEAGALEGLL